MYFLLRFSIPFNVTFPSSQKLLQFLGEIISFHGFHLIFVLYFYDLTSMSLWLNIFLNEFCFVYEKLLGLKKLKFLKSRI